MFVQQRHQAIVQQLFKEKSVKATELMVRFDVSFETIRRDLEQLEKQGLLRRVHGGAIEAEMDYSKELPHALRESLYTEEKNELAEIAVRYVEEGSSIALDVSTTNTLFAKILKQRITKLTVITNSLPIVNELMEVPGYTVILTGGVVRGEERSVIGELTEAFVAQFHVDLFFMSMSGMTLNEGVTDYGIGEVQLKKKLLANAKRTIGLADSSKFEAVSLLKVCPCADIDLFVTDSHIDPELVRRYKEQGINVVYQ